MTTPDHEPVGLPFDLQNYEPQRGVAGRVNELIESGQLPFDTFFRLAAVGYRTDPSRDSSPYFFNYHLMQDIVKNINTPDQMRMETQNILWGELPDAIVDINSHSNYPSYSQLGTMYYRMADLIRVIQERRLASGQALPEAAYNRRLHTVQDEWNRCRGIARPLWRLMVQRFHPEWLETPSDYFPSSYIGAYAVVYSIGEPRMRRGIVSHAVLSDPLIMSVYNEAATTGVKGIGPVGREDLRVLLSDEHPELLEGHELPADPLG